jgi:hypothetical protein
MQCMTQTHPIVQQSQVLSCENLNQVCCLGKIKACFNSLKIISNYPLFSICEG